MESDLNELLTTDRELTPQEMNVLHTQIAGPLWKHLVEVDMPKRAKATYSVTTTDQLRVCIIEHLDHAARTELATADVFNCTGCGRLLKDRRTPVASAILQERQRMRSLIREALDAPEGKERDEAIRRFAVALR